MEQNITIGERLKALRIEKGLTQDEMAKLLGVSKITVCRMETNAGDLSSEEVITLSKYFNINTDYLLCLTNIRVNFKENAHTGAPYIDTLWLDKIQNLNIDEIVDVINSKDFLINLLAHRDFYDKIKECSTVIDKLAECSKTIKDTLDLVNKYN